MYSIRVARDTVGPSLSKLMDKARRLTPVYSHAAAEAAKQIDSHLAKLQARGNKMGWPPRKFFHGGVDSVANNVRASANQKGATVVIDDYRFAHRLKGGVVKPRNAEALAIPQTGIAYHVTSPLRQTWPGLKMRWPGLFTGKTKQYGLALSVTHRPHPEERPDGRKIGPAIRREMVAAITRHFKGDLPTATMPVSKGVRKQTGGGGGGKMFSEAPKKFSELKPRRTSIRQVRSRGVIRGTRSIKPKRSKP